MNETFLSGGKKTLLVLRGLALTAKELRRESSQRVEFFSIERFPSGRLRSYGAFLRCGVAQLTLGRCRTAGEAVAELGDGRNVKSKVLLKVFKVVGVAVDMSSGRLLALLDVFPYDVSSDDVCNESFGLFVGGIDMGLGVPP